MNWVLVAEVARREIVTRARTRAFRVVAALLVAAAILGPIVAALVQDGDGGPREVTIGLIDVDAVTRDQIAAIAAGTLDVTFRDLAAAAVDEVVAGGDVDLALEPGPTVVWHGETDFEVAAVVAAAFQQRDILARGRALGLGDDDVAALLAPAPVAERFVDELDEGDDVAMAAAFVGLLLAFNIPLLFGQVTMMGVVEEKSTRVVEVLLGHVRPRTLLMGKVLGMGALALTQVVVAVAGMTAALLLTDAIDVPTSVWRFVPVVAVSLVGALAVYNTFFALLGSLVSRQEDVSQVIVPVFIPLMAGFFVAQAAVFGDAESPLLTALTLFPLTAPMLLPVRVARDAIPAWEVALALALMVAAVFVLIRVAGRVYEFTLLQTGSRVGWRQVLRLSRGAAAD